MREKGSGDGRHEKRQQYRNKKRKKDIDKDDIKEKRQQITNRQKVNSRMGCRLNKVYLRVVVSTYDPDSFFN